MTVILSVVHEKYESVPNYITLGDRQDTLTVFQQQIESNFSFLIYILFGFRGYYVLTLCTNRWKFKVTRAQTLPAATNLCYWFVTDYQIQSLRDVSLSLNRRQTLISSLVRGHTVLDWHLVDRWKVLASPIVNVSLLVLRSSIFLSCQMKENRVSLVFETLIDLSLLVSNANILLVSNNITVSTYCQYPF